MAKIIALTGIHGRLQVFECPPWRVVKLTSSPDGTSVDLSNGNGIATVKVSDTQQTIGIQLADGTLSFPPDEAWTGLLVFFKEKEDGPMIRSELVGKLVETHPHLAWPVMEAALDAILNEIINGLAQGQRSKSGGSEIPPARSGKRGCVGTPGTAILCR